MANIMINNNCNLRCPYCFADDYVGQRSVKNISLEDFEAALNFIKTEETPKIQVGIIGGEPLLHPNFDDIIDMCIKDKRVGGITVFTNGVFIDRHILSLTDPKVSILVNVNTKEIMGEKSYKKMIDNIDLLANKYNLKSNITLGLNFYPDKEEYSYIYDIVKMAGVDKLRTSITVPNNADNRDLKVTSYFKEMLPRVIDTFEDLVDMGVVPYLDCNYIPPCTLTEEQFNKLKRVFDLGTETEKRPDNNNVLNKPQCQPVIDINYNLNAVRCFGLADVGEVPIYWFKTIYDLNRYFLNQFDSFSYNLITEDNCSNCEDRLLMNCTGGCLAYKSKRIVKAIDIVNNIK